MLKCSTCKNDGFDKIKDGGTYQPKYNRYYCRSCNTIRYRKYRARNPIKIYEISRRSIKKHLLKQYARLKLNLKVRQGTIKKFPCLNCGKIEVEAHHPNYYKPLEVIWYCRLCHSQLHRFAKK